MEGRQGLRGGEANPNQRLGGTSGQNTSADSQRQPYKRPRDPQEGRRRQKTEEGRDGARKRQERIEERQGLRCGEANPNQLDLWGPQVRDLMPRVSVNPVTRLTTDRKRQDG